MSWIRHNHYNSTDTTSTASATYTTMFADATATAASDTNIYARSYTPSTRIVVTYYECSWCDDKELRAWNRCDGVDDCDHMQCPKCYNKEIKYFYQLEEYRKFMGDKIAPRDYDTLMCRRKQDKDGVKIRQRLNKPNPAV